METLRLLLGTITLRPYVFIFFGIYLFIAVTSIGWKRTGIFTLLAYIIAFLGEYSSSHGPYGIPFGVYRYEQVTRGRELWIAGVPFMDSLSFTFLSFISLRVATLLLSRLAVSRRDVVVVESNHRPHYLWVAALAGFLMMYLDIIIDPVALRGKRWYLGEIYFYPNGGSYFGVTLANFAGWFAVCFAIVVAFYWIERWLNPGPAPTNPAGSVGDGLAPPTAREGESRDILAVPSIDTKATNQAGQYTTPNDLPASQSPSSRRGSIRYRYKELAPTGLYFGILGYNLWVTFRIGEVSLGFAGLFISLPLLMLVVITVWRATL